MAVELQMTESYAHLNAICRDCGSVRFSVKSVEIPLTIETNTILVAVEVAECDRCGYQLVDGENAAKLDAAYDQLEAGNISQLTPVGVVYKQ